MKKLAKTINKIFSDKTFLEQMVKDLKSIHQIQSVMGKILTYYISTRDSKIYPYEEMCRLAFQISEPKNMRRNESVQDAFVRNIIDEGFVTHSFNGFNLSSIKKHGLGSSKNHDSVLGKELAKLERDLGVSEFVKIQSDEPSAIYYTSPGANSIYYAMQQSPERLFHGPLNQGKTPLPVLVGETKEEYYLRVAVSKINKMYSKEEQKPIIENAKKIIKKLCSQRPQIALIPISSKKYTLNASLAFVRGKPKTLKEYLNYQSGGNMAWWATTTFFADCLGGIHPSNCSNLVSVGVRVPASELQFISIPDSFEIAQLIALQKGLRPGEKFNLYTLEKVNDTQEKQETITQLTTGENEKTAKLIKTKKSLTQKVYEPNKNSSGKNK